jgi:hypothetical protein
MDLRGGSKTCANAKWLIDALTETAKRRKSYLGTYFSLVLAGSLDNDDSGLGLGIRESEKLYSCLAQLGLTVTKWNSAVLPTWIVLDQKTKKSLCCPRGTSFSVEWSLRAME